jgi:dTDP-4-dehydrorhamnose reductase
MRVLVFGSTGQVARELSRAAWPKETVLTFLDRRAADLSQPQALGAIVRAHTPDAVVIAAGYTKVDAAENDEATAHAMNAESPAAIARATAELSVPVIYLSTDYVFDGAKDGFYDEDDPVRPLNAYGRSKAAGEKQVRAANPKHLILRTSWVYSAHGANFLLAMLKRAKEAGEVRIVADQRGCPTAASDLAAAIAQAVPMLVAGRGAFGTFHAAGSSDTTWHGFAEAIFSALAARGLPRPKNLPISTADYPTPAKRPQNSRLSSARFAEAFGITLRGYAEAMPSVLDEALSALPAGATR